MRVLIRRLAIALAATSSVALAAAGGAQAVVIDLDASGTSVPYNSQSQAGYVGVAMDPAVDPSYNNLAGAGIPVVTSSGPCEDPALSPDFGTSLPADALCWHGGKVIHNNETFALTWDPDRRYWEGTRDYMEQFLSNVAAASGTGSSPYAVTPQYTDGTGRASYNSLYGGACVDFGDPGGYTCQLGDSSGSGVGNNYPANGCPVSGTNPLYENADYSYGDAPNDVCLTDTQIQEELAGSGSWPGLIPSSGLRARVKAGYSPLVVVLTPPGVEVCLDSSGVLCSANGGSSVRFCSYHSQVDVDGTEIPYVVEPWTPETGCDDPTITANDPITFPIDAGTLANDVGERLVSPLSQAEIAAITNPGLNAWFALDGDESNDNGCQPLPDGVDAATINGTSYYLDHEFNNGGTLVSDPNSPECAPVVNLVPSFVVPSSVDRGDEIQLDGSTTNSTLVVPKEGYYWNFGDGKTAYGPSVVHSYSQAGTYDITLTVTDRGGNVAKLTQAIQVIGPGTTIESAKGLKASLRLMPQSLHSVLSSGLSLHVTVNQTAAGFVTLSIPRSEARKAHIAGRGSSVVVGRGTVSQLKHGTASLRLRMSRRVVAKLKHLRQVTLTVRLQLIGSAGAHVAVDVAGRY